jgi:hypothetical protein
MEDSLVFGESLVYFFQYFSVHIMCITQSGWYLLVLTKYVTGISSVIEYPFTSGVGQVESVCLARVRP